MGEMADWVNDDSPPGDEMTQEGDTLAERISWAIDEEIFCSCDLRDESPCDCAKRSTHVAMKEVIKWMSTLPINMTASRVTRYLRSICEESGMNDLNQ